MNIYREEEGKNPLPPDKIAMWIMCELGIYTSSPLGPRSSVLHTLQKNQKKKTGIPARQTRLHGRNKPPRMSFFLSSKEGTEAKMKKEKRKEKKFEIKRPQLRNHCHESGTIYSTTQHHR